MLKFHLWLSVPVGLVVTIICFSGAMLVFEPEITDAVYKDKFYVKKSSLQPLAIDVLMHKAAATLPDSVQITSVNRFANPEKAYQIMLSKPRRASLYIDQYTGEILGKNERIPFFLTMFKMHRWLLDSNPGEGKVFWGKMIVGTCTIIFVFILLTGLIIWMPKGMKMLKNNLKIPIISGNFRFWRGLHVAGGFYALLILLVLSLTGLTWSFRWYNNGFYKVFGVEVPQRPANAPTIDNQNRGNQEKGNKREGAERGRRGGYDRNADGMQGEHKAFNPYLKWQTVSEQLAESNPDFKTINIGKGEASVSFDKWGNQRGSDKYKFNPRSGEITEISLYNDQPTSGKMRGWIYSVHVGSFGGLFTRILVFIASLIGASLPLTGYYFWIRRLIIKRRALNKLRICQN